MSSDEEQEKSSSDGIEEEPSPREPYTPQKRLGSESEGAGSKRLSLNRLSLNPGSYTPHAAPPPRLVKGPGGDGVSEWRHPQVTGNYLEGDPKWVMGAVLITNHRAECGAAFIQEYIGAGVLDPTIPRGAGFEQIRLLEAYPDFLPALKDCHSWHGHVWNNNPGGRNFWLRDGGEKPGRLPGYACPEQAQVLEKGLDEKEQKLETYFYINRKALRKEFETEPLNQWAFALRRVVVYNELYGDDATQGLKNINPDAFQALHDLVCDVHKPGSGLGHSLTSREIDKQILYNDSAPQSGYLEPDRARVVLFYFEPPTAAHSPQETPLASPPSVSGTPDSMPDFAGAFSPHASDTAEVVGEESEEEVIAADVTAAPCCNYLACGEPLLRGESLRECDTQGCGGRFHHFCSIANASEERSIYCAACNNKDVYPPPAPLAAAEAAPVGGGVGLGGGNGLGGGDGDGGGGEGGGEPGGGVMELEGDNDSRWTPGFNDEQPARGYDYRRPLRMSNESILASPEPELLSWKHWDVDAFKLTVDVFLRPKNLDGLAAMLNPITITLPHTRRPIHQGSMRTICIGMSERTEVHIRAEYKLLFLEQLNANLSPSDHGKAKFLRANQDPYTLIRAQNSSTSLNRFLTALRAIRVQHVMLKGAVGA